MPTRALMGPKAPKAKSTPPVHMVDAVRRFDDNPGTIKECGAAIRDIKRLLLALAGQE